MNKLRVWWIPQVPGESFTVDVDSVAEGVKILDVLSAYDAFQYTYMVKPDYANAGGLEEFDPDDKSEGLDGSWSAWTDPETGEDDPRAWLEAQK